MRSPPPESTEALGPLTRFADYFVPESVRSEGPDAVRRARMLVLFPYPVAVAAIPSSVEFSLRGSNLIAGVVLGAGVLAALSPYLVRWTGRIALISNLMLTLLVLSISVLALFGGGLGAPALYLLVAVPMLSTVVTNLRWGVFWAGVAVVELSVFAVLYAMDAGPPQRVGPDAILRGHGLVLGVLVGIILSGTAIYEKLKNRSLEDAERARIAAEQASVAKSEFLANMSHEIRTPMNGVLGASALLLDNSKLDADSRKLARIIHSSSESLLDVINDILDFSKLEAGQMGLAPRAFELERLIRSTVDLFRIQAAEANLQIDYQVESPAAVLFGDEGRLRQILVNLIGNSVKFTREGFVRVSARAVRHADRIRVELSVEDSGVGIAAGDLERIFDRFEQADMSAKRRHGGTGLGLAICQHLARLMGGSVRVESEPGVGSVFTVELEMEEADEQVQPSDAPPPRVPCDAVVLLAEDNAVNQMVVTRLLESLGCRVEVANDGHQAVERAEQGNYDLIFMDCSMPGLDGFEAARQIRGLESGKSAVPIVAFTASASVEDRDRCLAAGMDDLLAKPAGRDALEAALDRWLRQRGAA